MQDDTRAILDGNDEEMHMTIHNLAQLYATKNGFAKYLQTSSLFGTNVKNVFDEAIQQTVNHRKNKLAAMNI